MSDIGEFDLFSRGETVCFSFMKKARLHRGKGERDGGEERRRGGEGEEKKKLTSIGARDGGGLMWGQQTLKIYLLHWVQEIGVSNFKEKKVLLAIMILKAKF